MKSKRRLRLLILLIGVISLATLVVGLNRWTIVHTTSPIPIPTAVLYLAPDVTPTLGLSVFDSTGTAMVYVPAGCFIMGKDPPPDGTGYPGGQPFKMCLPHSYWIDKNDVTNTAYQQFIDVGGYGQQGTWWSDPGWAWVDRSTLFSMNGSRPYNYDGFTASQQPRVGVEWYEASAYCHWRGARLPTEPEWEYAARGPNSLIYPWGNTFDPSKVVYNGDDSSKPAPVGSKPSGASWVGALDMSGNVFQYTSTAYDQYDPTTEFSTDYRFPYPATNDGRENLNVAYQSIVVRGSIWLTTDIDQLRTANRFIADPDEEYYRQIDVGIRCVRSA